MKPLSALRSYALSLCIVYFICCYFSSLAQTYLTLRADYVSNPYNIPNISNKSYVGYGTDIVSIPNPSYTIFDVTSPPNHIINISNTVFDSAIKSLKATGHKVFLFNLPSGDLQSVRIRNASGQIIRSINPGMLYNNRQIIIDLQSLPPAHYFIEAVTRNGIYRKVLIRQ